MGVRRCRQLTDKLNEVQIPWAIASETLDRIELADFFPFDSAAKLLSCFPLIGHHYFTLPGTI